MGKSSNGPEWQDIRTLMKAMETMLDASVYLRIAPGPSVGSLEMILEAFVVGNRPASNLSAPAVGMKLTWPNRQNKTIESAVYRLMCELDAVAAKELWEQQRLA